MFKRLREALGLHASSYAEPGAASQPLLPPPQVVSADGRSFALAERLLWTEGLPHADWSAD